MFHAVSSQNSQNVVNIVESLTRNTSGSEKKAGQQMVTIRKVAEMNGDPKVTISIKDEEKEKLLMTLVNGQGNQDRI